jgi:methylisocitrate lyase
MSVGPPDKPGRALRRAMARGCVAMPGAFNAGVARLVERAGFGAVYVSGAGLANAAGGVPDIGLLGLDEVAQLSGYIARAVRIPAVVDADTGFGGAKETAQAVRRLERTGLAGLHIEDQVFPKRCGHLGGKELVPAREMVGKIRAAVGARSDKDFVIIARTDARAVEGFDAAVARAKLYLGAGADAVFPEALETAAEFRKFAREVPATLMANMTEFGKSPLLSVRQLESMGYRMAIFPMTAFRVAMKAAELCLADLRRRGTQRGWQGRMQTRAELYDLLGYDPAQSQWPTPLGGRKERST